jgi:hypothetical protein
MFRDKLYRQYLFYGLRKNASVIVFLSLIAAAFFVFLFPFGSSEMISGKVVGLQMIGSEKYGIIEIIVRLDDQKQIVVPIDAKANCMVGKSVLIQKNHVFLGDSYNALLNKCI